MILLVVSVGIAGFIFGGAIAYPIGRADGEKDASVYYEHIIRRMKLRS